MKDGNTQIRPCRKCEHYPPNQDFSPSKCQHRIWMLKDRAERGMEWWEEDNCWTPKGCIGAEGEAEEGI